MKIPGIRYALSRNELQEGRYADAAESYMRALTYAPADGSIHFLVADALFAQGDYHYAAYMITKALAPISRLMSQTIHETCGLRPRAAMRRRFTSVATSCSCIRTISTSVTHSSKSWAVLTSQSERSIRMMSST